MCSWKTEKCFHSRGEGTFYTRSLPGRSLKGKKKGYSRAQFRFLSNARYAGHRTRNIPHSIY